MAGEAPGLHQQCVGPMEPGEGVSSKQCWLWQAARLHACRERREGGPKIGVGGHDMAGEASQLKQALLSHELLCIVLPHTSWSMGLHHIIGSGSLTAQKTAVCVLHGCWEAWKLLGRVDFW